MYLVPIRLAWFWISTYLTEIVSAFLATGILRLRGVNGLAGWRYLFLIEGGITLAAGIASFWLMPRGPTQTRGWFTEREEGEHSNLRKEEYVDLLSFCSSNHGQQASLSSQQRTKQLLTSSKGASRRSQEIRHAQPRRPFSEGHSDLCC